MIAADTSAWIDFLGGARTSGADKVEEALSQGLLVLPPHVLFELLSSPGVTPQASRHFTALPRLDLLAGFWERAGKTRRQLLLKGLRARSMDCLIAQSCMDHGVALITGDQDFRHFVRHGLRLA